MKAGLPTMLIIDSSGLRGIADPGDLSSSSLADHWLVRFQDGQKLFVPKSLLEEQPDGSHRLAVSVDQLAREQTTTGYSVVNSAVNGLGDERLNTNLNTNEYTEQYADEIVVPIVAEQLQVTTRQRETGVVEIRKTIHERTEVVDHPLYAEEVAVERIPVNRMVDGPVSVRQEGEITIVPVLEEVLVVEKRLMLREEVHIRTVRKEIHDPQEVVLREERVEVVRKDGNEPNE
jgi:uncharacterized protein (TIGR02271 family)